MWEQSYGTEPLKLLPPVRSPSLRRLLRADLMSRATVLAAAVANLAELQRLEREDDAGAQATVSILLAEVKMSDEQAAANQELLAAAALSLSTASGEAAAAAMRESAMQSALDASRQSASAAATKLEDLMKTVKVELQQSQEREVELKRQLAASRELGAEAETRAQALGQRLTKPVVRAEPVVRAVGSPMEAPVRDPEPEAPHAAQDPHPDDFNAWAAKLLTDPTWGRELQGTRQPLPLITPDKAPLLAQLLANLRGLLACLLPAQPELVEQGVQLALQSLRQPGSHAACATPFESWLKVSRATAHACAERVQRTTHALHHCITASHSLT